MQEVKKEFQKVVAHIRTAYSKGRQIPCEYPKAMMTGQQAAKHTATVNCAGSDVIAERVLAHPAFIAFLRSHNATAAVESFRCGSGTQYHVRINFGGGGINGNT